MVWFHSLWRSWRLRSTARRKGSAVPNRYRPQTLEFEPRVMPSTVGVYALLKAGTPIPPKFLNDPQVTARIDGFALRVHWDDLEKSEGVFDWSSYLDPQIQNAIGLGKKVSLSITAGIYTPAWVYSAGAHQFPVAGTTTTVPIPWDPVFLSKWTAFIQAFGNHFNDLPTEALAITNVKITGINTDSDETALPASPQDLATWRALPPTLTYSSYRVDTTWQTIADTFAQAFPHQQLALIVRDGAFPPLDGTSDTITNGLISLGMGRHGYGAQLIVQNNALKDHYSFTLAANVADQVVTGYQMLSWVSNNANYPMNDGTPIDYATELQNAVSNGTALNARFLEIYSQDITDTAPSLTPVVAAAQAQLTSPANTNAIFVGQIYWDLLHRPVDSSGFQTWTGALAHGATDAQVAQALLNSTEYRTNQINSWYQAYLGRSVDPSGLSQYLGSFANGATDEQIQAALLGSTEFFQDHGSTNASFLSAVYKLVLHRPVDPTGSQIFLTQLANGVSRVSVAQEILASTEYQTDLVQSFYATFLRRAADPTGLNAFVTQLANGARDEDILAQILSSGEYLGLF